jgi:hypothetical protein
MKDYVKGVSETLPERFGSCIDGESFGCRTYRGLKSNEDTCRNAKILNARRFICIRDVFLYSDITIRYLRLDSST